MPAATLIKFDERESKQLDEMFGRGNGANLCISRAINKTLAWSRSRTADAITKSLPIKRSDLDGRHRAGGITITRAKTSNLQGKLVVDGKRIPVFLFSPSPKDVPMRKGLRYSRLKDHKEMVSKGPRKWISWKIWRDKGRTRATKNAFIARLKSGHLGFFRRTGKKRLPIAELRGPSIPMVAQKSPEFQKLQQADAGAQLTLNMRREANFILTGNSTKGPAGDLSGMTMDDAAAKLGGGPGGAT